MIERRDGVAALLELASQATTDGVRATALRRIEALADAELDRARRAAHPVAMREALRPGMHALARRSVVVRMLDARDPDNPHVQSCDPHGSEPSIADRFLRNALTLGVPVVRRSSVPVEARGARCWRMLASVPVEYFASLARDVGCLVCAVLVRDLDRVNARRFLEVLGSDRTALGRLARHVPAPDDDLARWTLDLVDALGSTEPRDALATFGGALIQSLTVWMEPDVAAAMQRRLGPLCATVAPVPQAWRDAVRGLVEVNKS